MSKKISCGGFYIDENNFNIDEEGKLSLKPTETPSLADLSDVEIDESTSSRQMLKYNDLIKKWENVSEVEAILTFPDPSINQGVVFINDAEEVLSATSVRIPPSSEQAFLFTSIIESAIANGQGQTNNLPKRTFRDLILGAMNSVLFNIPFYLFIGDIIDMQASLSLDSVTSDYVTFVGTTFYNSKFYRITLIIYCPDTAGAATVLAKAEELMTYTEPTQTP